jgi:hypothetical protein
VVTVSEYEWWLWVSMSVNGDCSCPLFFFFLNSVQYPSQALRVIFFIIKKTKLKPTLTVFSFCIFLAISIRFLKPSEEKWRGQTPKEFNNIWYVASRDQYATFKTPKLFEIHTFQKNQSILIFIVQKNQFWKSWKQNLIFKK